MLTQRIANLIARSNQIAQILRAAILLDSRFQTNGRTTI
jgi:hypothetical protein